MPKPYQLNFSAGRAAVFRQDFTNSTLHRLTSPKHKVPKIYRATLDRDLDPTLVALFAAGSLQLEDEKQPCAPAELRIVSPREAELTLTEGKYHQVRRMFAAAGNTVLTLHRARFGSLELGELRTAELEAVLDVDSALGVVGKLLLGVLEDAHVPWVDAQVDPRTNIDIENAILTRARQLRIAGGS